VATLVVIHVATLLPTVVPSVAVVAVVAVHAAAVAAVEVVQVAALEADTKEYQLNQTTSV
jgi:hypothetical protein